jgi:hypothetical protein
MEWSWTLRMHRKPKRNTMKRINSKESTVEYLKIPVEKTTGIFI